VASLVPQGSRVADIGTGHGLLARRLLASGRSPHCIATERTPALLREVRRYPAAHRLAGALELRSGDGLAPLRRSDSVDVVVIAGLGGPSILRILDRSPLPCSTFRRIVLQPQTDPARLRKGLYERGLQIVAEQLVRQRERFYLALAVEPRTGAAPPVWAGLRPEELLEAGPCLLRQAHPLLVPYWRNQVGRLERIVEGPGGVGGRQAVHHRLEIARRVLRVASRDC